MGLSEPTDAVSALPRGQDRQGTDAVPRPETGDQPLPVICPFCGYAPCNCPPSTVPDDDAWSVELPWPDKELGGNAGWGRGFMAAKAAARETAWGYALEQPTPDRPYDCVWVVVVFHPPDQRRRDLDNMLRASKSYIDGLVLANVITDDGFKVVRRITCTVGELRRPDGAVEITIVPLSA